MPLPVPRNVAFWFVVALYVVVLSGITLPTPLYVIYQSRWDLSNSTITLLFATYPVAVLFVLVLAGHWSDAIGRRPVLVAAIAASVVSSAIFLVAQNYYALFLARAVSGIASGLVVGTANAALIELASATRHRWASLVSTVTNQFGLGLGALVAGVLAEFVPGPTHVVFAAHLACLGAAAVCLLFVPETVRAREFHSVKQRLRLPRSGRAEFVAAAGAAFSAFALCGLLAALAPTFVRTGLSNQSYAAGGAVVFLIFAASAMSQPVWFYLPEVPAMIIGLTLFVTGLSLITFGLWRSSTIVFLSGILVGGAAVGAVFMGSLAVVNAHAGVDERSQVTSSYFAVAFSGLVLPVIGAGWAADRFGPTEAALIFAITISLLAMASASLIIITNYHVSHGKASTSLT